LKYILFISLIFLSGTNNPEKYRITGQLKTIVDSLRPNIKYASLIISSQGKKLKGVNTDSKGYFSFSLPESNSTDIDIVYYSMGLTEMYVKHISQLTEDSIFITIDIPNAYKFTRNGKVICPKCNKSDQSYAVLIAWQNVQYYKINKASDTLFFPIDTVKYSNAWNCLPVSQFSKWYCVRDSIYF
jgi:hypothetical protein